MIGENIHQAYWPLLTLMTTVLLKSSTVSLESLPFCFSKMTTWCLLSQPPMLLQSLENWWPSSCIRTSSSPHPHHQIHKPLWGLILTFPVILAGLSKANPSTYAKSLASSRISLLRLSPISSASILPSLWIISVSVYACYGHSHF